jgi:hypothetical protein
MPRQRQEAGAGSINLQAGRDLSVVVSHLSAPADNDDGGAEVQARVHWALLLSDPRRPGCYFVNVINRSRVSEVTVTHVWFETDPRRHVLTRRPGPIAPLSQWETWIEADELPFSPMRYEWLARVQLGDDTVIESVPRSHVPEVGYVPGEVYGFSASGTSAPPGSHVSSYAASASVAVTGVAGSMDLGGRVDLPPDVSGGSERRPRRRISAKPDG